MIIGIISDTHDNIPAIKKSVELFNERNVDFVIHLGDIVSPFCFDVFDELQMDFIGVFGNNDGEWLYLEEKARNRLFKPPYEIELDKKSFVLMHEPFGIDKLANEYDYCLYGHLHKIDIRKTKRGYIINPGELCGYLTGKKTLAILNTDKNKVELIVV